MSTPPSLSEAASKETRQRLLDAAGEVFAESGFRCATIREICGRAKANVAAVNYHFGDKERLYAEVLKYAHSCCNEPQATEMDESAPPEDRLHGYVLGLLRRLFKTGRPAWRGKLMSREMIEPTAALDRVVEEEIRPRIERLERIVRAIAGPNVSDRRIRAATKGIIGQVVFYHHSRPVIQRIDPQLTMSEEQVLELAQYITDFSLIALRGLASIENADARLEAAV